MHSLRQRPQRITAIVPTLNEEGDLKATLASLRDSGLDEILVVDGGSRDGTLKIAREGADRVFSAEGGLFAQLECGARAAAGDVFLFHYADVMFPIHGCDALSLALEDPRLVGGAFKLRFPTARWRYAVTAFFANWRNRFRLGPFGDQSLFVRAETFRELQGFREDAFFEDFDLVRRLRRKGRFSLLDLAVEVSIRRWENWGFYRTLWSHYRLYWLYFTRRGRPGSHSRRLASKLRGIR